MATYRTIAEMECRGKNVIVRAGFDVPIVNGEVVDTARIEAVLPTINAVRAAGGRVILIAHQDRPKGKRVPAMSQKPVAEALKHLLATPVSFVNACVGNLAEEAARMLKNGDLVLLENLRFEPGEERNDEAFAKMLAKLGDFYVNDAFANAHRMHASMVALPRLLPAYMGLRLQEEIQHLHAAMEHPKRPVALIISGAKMETKVPVIQRFLHRCDDIVLGGAIANTFLAARGFDIGASLYEEEFIVTAQEIMLESEKEGNARIHVPRDGVVATKAQEHAEKIDLPIEDIVGDMAIFDIGKITIDRYCEILHKAKTIIWNGPLGRSEINRFSHATKRIAECLMTATQAGAATIVGGGDTIDFHTQYGYPLSAYTFVSTGGGAMLEYLSGGDLPALKALEV